MDATLQNAISVLTARLRREYPALGCCEAVIDGVANGTPRFSARLDLRLPERQILVCGKAADTVDGALEAALAEARERLAGSGGRRG